MRLTWKDAFSTVFMAAIVIIYVAFLNSTTAWLISSARGTAATVLVLGIVGGCGMSAAAEQAGAGLHELRERARRHRSCRGGDRADHREVIYPEKAVH
jgi:hypothetical protein